jgi:predicted permease
MRNSGGSSRRPPRFSRWLIARICCEDDRRFVLSDMDEEFESTAERKGDVAARRWYRGQMLRSAGPCLVRRLRRVVGPGRSAAAGRGEALGSFAQDARHAGRYLTQRPFFTMVAALSIALGVGATTAIVSVANTVLFQPPTGVAGADRVVEVGRTQGGRGFDTFSYVELNDLRSESTPFVHMAGTRQNIVSFMSGGTAEQVLAAAVSQSYFDVMGIVPAVGRFFRPDEDVTPGAHAVAVVSWRFWQDRLGGEANAVGRTIDVNRQPFAVVGVMPETFRGHVLGIAPGIWLPLTMYGSIQPGFDSYDSRRASWLTIVGRLGAGATIEQADASVKLVMSRHTPVAADPRNQRSAEVRSLGAVPSGGRPVVAAFLGMLAGLVVIVLVVTAANVAGMLLARGAAREREIAIRMALGSGRGRLMRQLLMESVMIFLLGGFFGIALAWWATGLIGAIQLPVPIPVEFDMRPDAKVLSLGLGVALVTGLIFGLAPALQAGRTDLNGALKVDSRRRGSRGGRVRRGFVMAQVGLSLVLLLVAGLFLRSLQQAADIDTGFDPSGVLMVGFDLGRDGYDEGRGVEFLENLRTTVASLPGVAAAGYASELPLDLGRSESPVYPEGYESGDSRPWVQSDFAVVSEGYFDAAGIAVRRGRAFTGEDRLGGVPTVIVNRTMVERVWPDADPLGMRIRVSSPEGELLTVVGVVDDIKNSTLMDAPVPMAYLPLAQNYLGGVTLLARSGNDELAFAARLREVVLAADARLALSPVQSFAAYTAVGVLPQRLAAGITGGLGVLAVVLSALGIYGVIAFAVAQRTREIGIRMALGAHSQDVLRLVVRDGLRLALPGLVFGLVAGIGLSFLIRGFILGVAPADPVTFASALVVLLGAVLLASIVPARRASRVEPTRALRTE